MTNAQDTVNPLAIAKAEILADIASGVVPATVKSFSELHDYVDANCYGEFADDYGWASKMGWDDLVALWDNTHSQLDAWIKAGMPND